MKTIPTVSVVIPTYNCASLLPKAIQSAYAQTIQPHEVIVIDDGCTDNTAEVIRQWMPELPDNFIYEYKVNGGEASARNRGVARATGDFVAFIDQDDLWLPDKLEKQLTQFERDVTLGMSFTAYTRISGDERELVQLSAWETSTEYALRQLMIGCCITPSTVMVRREVLQSVGPFDESFWLGCDWDMWLRIAAAGHRIAYLAEPLTEYLWHTNNMSRDLRRIANAANVIFPRLFDAGVLPAAVQSMRGQCLARWKMIGAEYSLAAGETAEARQSLLEAIRLRPASVRPGWIKMFLRSLRHPAKLASQVA